MVFCNIESLYAFFDDDKVTILILIDGFLQYTVNGVVVVRIGNVTILILIDGFLQLV